MTSESKTMLGRQVDADEYGVLDTFSVAAPVKVQFQTQELQALCPAVEAIQPDIYDATLTYTAVTQAIESKSLKLWLVTYREQRIFGEHLACELYDHLARLQPAIADIHVRLVQNIRGGIVTVIDCPEGNQP